MDDMLGALLDKIDGMDDAWDDILTLVGRHSKDTQGTALYQKWSRIIESTKKTTDMALGSFHKLRLHLGSLHKLRLHFGVGRWSAKCLLMFT